MSDHLQVQTTLDDSATADRLARTLVEARTAACAQVVGPIRSTYWWKGAVQTTEEWQLHLKTTAECYPRLEAAIREHHPYDVPEIIALPILTGDDHYLAWITAETRP